MTAPVVFDDVSKKFRRGERHDSLRDLVPALVQGLFRPRPADALDDQEFWAVRNVSFEVHHGTALGIIGPNGAGKSTTLKLLTKILKPTTGRSIIRGRVGALIEVAAGFHPDLTGRENISLQGAIMGMKKLEIDQRFDEIVEFAGVADFVDTPVKRYSSGMNARLGFSIAAHLRPEVLIIDEVLSVGDMAFQQKCFDRMLEFKRQGIAIVLVSHNLQAVSELCEQAVYLASTVRAAGPAVEVLDAYMRDSTKPEENLPSGPVNVVGGTLVSPDGRSDTHFDVPPGQALDFRIVIRSREPLDDVTFGILVHRSTDWLVVYDGNVHRRDLGSPAGFIGEFVVEFALRAHFVRGHYCLSMHVFDNPTQTFLVPERQVATLTVKENRSHAGVADIELTASLRTAQVAPAAKARE